MMSDLSELEWAYLAGIIDGEGSIAIYRFRDSYRPEISVFNTNVELKQWLKTRLGGYVNPPRQQNPRQKPAFKWRTTTLRQMKEICQRCLPYLIVKRPQALIILRFPL